MEPTQYCAFISYRHQSPDQEIAKALHTAIETYGIPAAVIGRVTERDFRFTDGSLLDPPDADELYRLF